MMLKAISDLVSHPHLKSPFTSKDNGAHWWRWRTHAAVLGNVATPQFYGGFGIGANGVLYAGNGDQHQLFRLNPATGAATLIGDTGRTFVGDLAFLTPEPASIGLAGIGGLGLALLGWRRNRPIPRP